MAQLTLEQAFDLAFSHHTAGRLDQAMEIYQRILQVIPDNPDTLHFLGVILMQTGRPREGEQLMRKSLSISPDNPVAYSNLGNALHLQGRTDEAIECIKKSIKMDPGIPENYNNLGNAYRDKGLRLEAKEFYARAIELKNNYADAYNNLGTAHQEDGLLDDAIACYKRSIAISPDLPDSYNNMGNALKDQGRLREAIEVFRTAILKKPDFLSAYSDLVLVVQYDPDFDDWMIRRELQAWSDAIARPRFAHIRPHSNDRNSERTLKVGFVSPDFRMHPVGRLMIPLLEKLDPSQVQTHCYYHHAIDDGITDICRKKSAHWLNVMGYSENELAEKIREDRIDILVDLTSHTAANKLTVFARKPAPVQVTWLAYCGTTGLKTMDYRISDPQLDPPDSDLTRYIEQTVFLPSYWCYPVHGGIGEPGPLPSLKNGRVTFGCLNNFCKISPGAAQAWLKLLAMIPDSRLMLYSHPGTGRDNIRRVFADGGVDPNRIEFIERLGFFKYMETYHDIDIALDPFPFNGGITTCDALWMGVPVISLIGKRAVGRAGLSILTQAGLPELAADSIDEYIHKAAGLARDPARLSEIRSTLRDRMRQSPLMSSDRFARDMENAFRIMWRRWCAG